MLPSAITDPAASVAPKVSAVSVVLSVISLSAQVVIGHSSFLVGQCKGQGSYGKVFKAMRKDDKASLNETIAGMDVVLKIQKPAREWEFYACTELHER